MTGKGINEIPYCVKCWQAKNFDKFGNFKMLAGENFEISSKFDKLLPLQLCNPIENFTKSAIIGVKCCVNTCDLLPCF